MTHRPESPPARRGALLVIGLAAGAGLWLPACAKKDEEPEVGAVEDLMREHGVLRRILVVYRQAGMALRINSAAVDAGAIGEAAGLFQTFGEDYHERGIEETYLFPALAKAGGPAGALVGVLKTQHDRGRQITGFVKTSCASGRVGAADAEPVARALESMAQMYEAHTAFEDTVVFPAWKKTMSEHQLKDMGDRFEDIEKKTFHGDGFDMAQAQIGRIEQRLGLQNLAAYTAPPPPGAAAG
jgi:hemerythrin-like domain-containing protein